MERGDKKAMHVPGERTQRPCWTGYMKLSMISCPIAIYPATTPRERSRDSETERRAGSCICRRKATGNAGQALARTPCNPVEPDRNGTDQAKAMEVSAGEGQRVIEIEECILRGRLDARFVDMPYYIVPDGHVGQEAFAAIRSVLDREWMAALGRITFTSREHIIAAWPCGNGLLAVTLRDPADLRDEDAYVGTIGDPATTSEMYEFVARLIQSRSTYYNPSKVAWTLEDSINGLIAKQASRAC